MSFARKLIKELIGIVIEFRLKFNKHLIDSTFSLIIHFLEEAIRTRSWEFCDFYLEIVETISVVMEILMEEIMCFFDIFVFCIFVNLFLQIFYKLFISKLARCTNILNIHNLS